MPVEAIVFLGGPLLCFLLFTILSWRGRHRLSAIAGAVVTVVLAACLFMIAWTSSATVTTSDSGPGLVVTPTSVPGMGVTTTPPA